MNVERLSRSSLPAVDLTEAKNHARVDGDFEDADFARMIDTATREAEDYAQIALLAQNIRLLLSRWPRGHVRLPIVPILDRNSISVTINTQPWPDVLLSSDGSRPLLIMCGNPPPGVFVIEYRAGFGDQPEDIPADLRHALLDQIATYYDARGAVDGKTATLSPHFARIVGRYRGVRA